jgi:hypothetical protein
MRCTMLSSSSSVEFFSNEIVHIATKKKIIMSLMLFALVGGAYYLYRGKDFGNRKNYTVSDLPQLFREQQDYNARLVVGNNSPPSPVPYSDVDPRTEKDWASLKELRGNTQSFEKYATSQQWAQQNSSKYQIQQPFQLAANIFRQRGDIPPGFVA